MDATKVNTDKVINGVLAGDLANYESFIHTDGIRYTLDGSAMAEWLEYCGYTVLSFADTGSCGLVTLSNGVKVSTNGYVYK